MSSPDEFLLFTDENAFTAATPRPTQNDCQYAHPSTKKKDVAT